MVYAIPFSYKGDVIMARKSRKHPELAVPVSKDTVGYIRLSVLNRDPHGSVENQRLMIEEWGQQADTFPGIASICG